MILYKAYQDEDSFQTRLKVFVPKHALGTIKMGPQIWALIPLIFIFLVMIWNRAAFQRCLQLPEAVEVELPSSAVQIWRVT